jgi:hypothetical protein
LLGICGSDWELPKWLCELDSDTSSGFKTFGGVRIDGGPWWFAVWPALWLHVGFIVVGLVYSGGRMDNTNTVAMKEVILAIESNQVNGLEYLQHVSM